MHRPKISIIIPVYNVEVYVSRLLDSILAQIYEDYEVIIVDDGSTDGSGKICDEYTWKDSRIRVLHKANGGVSSARNMGIRSAVGEWIYFCDSDDELLPDALNTLLDSIGQSVQFVMAGYEVVEESGITHFAMFPTRILTSYDGLKELFSIKDKRYDGYLWTKLFKTDIIKQNDLHFDTKIYYNEDRLFIFEYLSKITDSVCYTSAPVYRYYIRQSGAMTSIHKGQYRKFYTDLDAYLLMLRLSKSLGNTALSKLIKYNTYFSYRVNVGLTRRYSKSPAEEIEILRNKIRGIFSIYEQVTFRSKILYRRIMVKIKSLIGR